MMTPYGHSCAYYYQDFHRGRSVRECRLPRRHTGVERWEPVLCKTCPVPAILRANACSRMVLEGQIRSHLVFWRRMQVSAFCLETTEQVQNPHVGCGQCHEHYPAVEALLGLAETSEPAKSRTISSGSKRGSS